MCVFRSISANTKWPSQTLKTDCFKKQKEKNYKGEGSFETCKPCEIHLGFSKRIEGFQFQHK